MTVDLLRFTAFCHTKLKKQAGPRRWKRFNQTKEIMGASHFLDIGPLPDAKRPGVTHDLEVFENGGELFLRANITPPTGDLQAFTATGAPYTGKIEVSIKLTTEQMKALEEALEGARTRLAY